LTKISLKGIDALKLYEPLT